MGKKIIKNFSVGLNWKKKLRTRPSDFLKICYKKSHCPIHGYSQAASIAKKKKKELHRYRDAIFLKVSHEKHFEDPDKNFR